MSLPVIRIRFSSTIGFLPRFFDTNRASNSGLQKRQNIVHTQSSAPLPTLSDRPKLVMLRNPHNPESFAIVTDDSPASNIEGRLRTPVDELPGVTALRRAALARLDIHTVGDLLFHFPRAYEDLTDLRPIREVTAGALQTVQGEVVEMDTRTLPNGGFVVSIVLCDDGLSVLEGAWFNQSAIARRFRFGQHVAFSGKVKWYRDHWQMTSPRVQFLEADAVAEPGIVPIYPLTEDLRGDQLRPLVGAALEFCAGAITDTLPSSVCEKHSWPEPVTALRCIHFPTNLDHTRTARRRFLYEELFLLQVALRLRRRESADRQKAPILPVSPEVDGRIRRLFPYSFTADQDAAITDIRRDLNSDRPMQRLVQADVGAGKTAVAVYAMLSAIANRHQAALMAPTEVLARQHARVLDRLLERSRVRRLLLTGALTPAERRDSLDALRRGEIDLVIGTQALVQEGVEFSRLGLVVIDEQHKFGVHQRARVRRLGTEPHYLVLTATPIPRTVALTVFGDLDVSVIRQLPPGRQPVETRWLRETDRPRVNALVADGLRAGRQAYVVCPLVEESESLDVPSATRTFDELRNSPFREFRLGLLHGRQDDDEKADVMDRFSRGEIQLLVCTSVVEVGIDVPGATLMVIEHAERFGLSQLHQLRGRVARGTVPGQCFLFADPAGEEGRERLRVFTHTSDGFALAEEDARLRGVGELFGTRQHGQGSLSPGSLGEDADLLDVARADARELVDADPGLTRPEHALLRAAVLVRYGDKLDLAEVG
jgi:ATP-dependent DNA helicase RecG